jgi:hypothetical protein
VFSKQQFLVIQYYAIDKQSDRWRCVTLERLVWRPYICTDIGHIAFRIPIFSFRTPDSFFYEHPSFVTLFCYMIHSEQPAFWLRTSVRLFYEHPLETKMSIPNTRVKNGCSEWWRRNFWTPKHTHHASLRVHEDRNIDTHVKRTVSSSVQPRVIAITTALWRP